VHQAKTQLSQLLRRVENGEEVVVTRGGRAVARIVGIQPPRGRNDRFGLLAAEIADPGDWDDEDGEALGDLFGIPREEAG